MSEKDTPILVLSTCPGSISAKKIAQELVSDKLAACVNIIPGILSYFSWVGKVDKNEEYLLLIKTTEQVYSKLESRLRSIHPYELPEIIVVPIKAGLDDYLNWIKTNTNSS